MKRYNCFSLRKSIFSCTLVPTKHKHNRHSCFTLPRESFLQTRKHHFVCKIFYESSGDVTFKRKVQSLQKMSVWSSYTPYYMLLLLWCVNVYMGGLFSTSSVHGRLFSLTCFPKSPFTVILCLACDAHGTVLFLCT